MEPKGSSPWHIHFHRNYTVLFYNQMGIIMVLE